MEELRKSIASSIYYPDDIVNLKWMINNFLSEVPDEIPEYFKKNSIDHIFGLITPHAAYNYSGLVSASSYILLKQKKIDNVFIIGPSHFHHFEGFALPYYKIFSTPFGKINVNYKINEALIKASNGLFDYINSAHEKEHCIELQLPFLQTVLSEDFTIIPILTGNISLELIKKGAEIIHNIISNSETYNLFISTIDMASSTDRKLSNSKNEHLIELIENFEIDKIWSSALNYEIESCGINSIILLLELSRLFNKFNIKKLIYQNNQYNINNETKFVGYLSLAIW